MEYVDLVQERLAHYENERKQIALTSELRRLGLPTSGRSAFAHFDSLIIKASKGAKARQARREGVTTNRRELVS